MRRTTRTRATAPPPLPLPALAQSAGQILHEDAVHMYTHKTHV